MLQNLRRAKAKEALFDLIRFLSRPNTYTTILALLLVILIVGTVLVWFFELDPTGEPALRDMNNSFVYMLQNATGVGLGATAPRSMWGRATGVVFVILAAGLRAIFVAA